MATKRYSDPELGAMPNVNATGLNEAYAANKVMKKVTDRVGSKRVPRQTAPKNASTKLIRTGPAVTPPSNANSTTTGVTNSALMASAKKLLSK
jgi:hypothetical protein